MGRRASASLAGSKLDTPPTRVDNYRNNNLNRRIDLHSDAVAERDMPENLFEPTSMPAQGSGAADTGEAFADGTMFTDDTGWLPLST